MPIDSVDPTKIAKNGMQTVKGPLIWNSLLPPTHDFQLTFEVFSELNCAAWLMQLIDWLITNFLSMSKMSLLLTCRKSVRIWIIVIAWRSTLVERPLLYTLRYLLTYKFRSGHCAVCTVLDCETSLSCWMFVKSKNLAPQMRLRVNRSLDSERKSGHVSSHLA